MNTSNSDELNRLLWGMQQQCRVAYSFLESEYGFSFHSSEEDRVLPYPIEHTLQHDHPKWRVYIAFDFRDHKVLTGIQGLESAKLFSPEELLDAAESNISAKRTYAVSLGREHFPDYLRAKAAELRECFGFDFERLNALTRPLYDSAALNPPQHERSPLESDLRELIEASWARWRSQSSAESALQI